MALGVELGYRHRQACGSSFACVITLTLGKQRRKENKLRCFSGCLSGKNQRGIKEMKLLAFKRQQQGEPTHLRIMLPSTCCDS